MASLTATELAALLDILNNPDNAGFATALERLTTLDTSTLTPEAVTQLTAKLDATITKLRHESRLTEAELARLRKGNKALQSYNR